MGARARRRVRAAARDPNALLSERRSRGLDPDDQSHAADAGLPPDQPPQHRTSNTIAENRPPPPPDSDFIPVHPRATKSRSPSRPKRRIEASGPPDRARHQLPPRHRPSGHRALAALQATPQRRRAGMTARTPQRPMRRPPAASTPPRPRRRWRRASWPHSRPAGGQSATATPRSHPRCSSWAQGSTRADAGRGEHWNEKCR